MTACITDILLKYWFASCCADVWVTTRTQMNMIRLLLYDKKKSNNQPGPRQNIACAIRYHRKIILMSFPPPPTVFDCCLFFGRHYCLKWANWCSASPSPLKHCNTHHQPTRSTSSPCQVKARALARAWSKHGTKIQFSTVSHIFHFAI